MGPHQGGQGSGTHNINLGYWQVTTGLWQPGQQLFLYSTPCWVGNLAGKWTKPQALLWAPAIVWPDPAAQTLPELRL